ncbi:outer membrane protein assembly factor BamD [Sphingorhabdus contaminans]|jgi:outer membrane protein assembly factor BamD|uniref:Outer membrane protein assembly factor BamD n=1 Tax=Sphingorhabdus contaminans TaxID=1343899 RepID=A0A553WIK2_9SPHN|nr:outer membrane protein assembly factor BamD [Sphingorhabdus contaminans]TSB04513.1 outer membrane protein assembly factor BamD [Sphingorhabdus contaminans]
MNKKLLVPVAVLAASSLLSGCAALGLGGGDAKPGSNTRYVARDVNTLYAAAKEKLDNQQYVVAAALFDEVERQHPYSPWARRAQLMSAFSYYMAQKYNESIQSSRRFLSIHPGNKDAAYAYYLIALNYYEQISDVTRDQKISEQALAALGEVQRRYPTSRYAADATLKMDLVRDHLAGKEMEIGRFYQRRALWLASSLRFREVVEKFDTTTHAPEALYRLTESYLAMGVPEEAKKAAAVLGANYPGSEWYKRAYDLMQKHAPSV